VSRPRLGASSNPVTLAKTELMIHAPRRTAVGLSPS
jgi:hypothetical protein